MSKDKLGDALRSALAPLRGSIRYAFLGLAAIAIAGCGAPTVCVDGVQYSDGDGSGVYTAHSGKCISEAQAIEARQGGDAGSIHESAVGETDAPNTSQEQNNEE